MDLRVKISEHFSAFSKTVDDMDGYAPFSSIAFHVFLVAMTLIGMPFVTKEQPVMQQPIMVELVEISDKTLSTERPKPVKVEVPKEQERPKKSKPNMSAVPPDLLSPPPLDPPVETDKNVEEPSAPDPVAVPSIKPQIKPKPPVKNKPKPKPPEPPAPESDPELIEDQEAMFSSLLKNITPDLEEAPARAVMSQDQGQARSAAPLGERMTMSELDAFRQQLAPCWIVQAGARYAENLLVEVRIVLGRDQFVRSAAIVDQMRYNLDRPYRAAADAALRALRNPACQPFNLPIEKYEQWKVMTIRFDPRDML